ncbi:DNA helicase PIF1, ATP-dependent [Corchorus olitorius]|uniref:ATP-dependent DNA helicase n=1 Tax=Corchorus olitorius TaxID=93759 RepID=A0A1R3JFZ2_9ROSI|nr:DNA helicase PIF1, ATP-dependent [Corchorus olitorius]
MGAKVDGAINNSRGPYVFQTLGENYHLIGIVLPVEGKQPKYAQLYIVDTENELQNCINNFTSNASSDDVREDIVDGIGTMLDQTNEIVKVFRKARDTYRHDRRAGIRIRLVTDRGNKTGVYNLPTANEIGGVIVGEFGMADTDRDVIIQYRSGRLIRIIEYHPLFMSLQYPLLFPYGEDGYHSHIPYTESPTRENVVRRFITMREYYCYQLQHRDPQNNALFHGGRLFQQYCVDSYGIVRETKLNYLKIEQELFRVDAFGNVRDAVSQGDLRGEAVGKRIVLLASFTSSPRYIYYGFPTLFITFTCNAQWQEIQETLRDIKGQKAKDRPDIVCRVFKIKLKNLIDDLTKSKHFGEAMASVLYPTFKQACHALGLLGDDKEWITELEEAYVHATSRQLRGTGKTFLWNTIIAGIRSVGKIALAVASSGIASLLLPGGRTAHSRFKIPSTIQECSTCTISKGTQLAKLINSAALIVWDEAPMIHMHCIEAMDKTLKDIITNGERNGTKLPFGGKTILFGGDFRQILPVIPSGSKSQILNAALYNSPIWTNCKLLTLTENMRLKQDSLNTSSRQELKNFSDWLLKVGEGRVGFDEISESMEGNPTNKTRNVVYREIFDNLTSE